MPCGACYSSRLGKNMLKDEQPAILNAALQSSTLESEVYPLDLEVQTLLAVFLESIIYNIKRSSISKPLIPLHEALILSK